MSYNAGSYTVMRTFKHDIRALLPNTMNSVTVSASVGNSVGPGGPYTALSLYCTSFLKEELKPLFLNS